MATKSVDVKRGRVLLQAIESLQNAGGKFCTEQSNFNGVRVVMLNSAVEVMVENDVERKKLMDDINKTLGALFEPYLLRYHQEHRALVPSAKKDT